MTLDPKRWADQKAWQSTQNFTDSPLAKMWFIDGAKIHITAFYAYDLSVLCLEAQV